MCGLCGFWGGKAHWSTKSQNPKVFGETLDSSERLRERAHQRMVLNRITRPFDVVVRDWETSQWILEHVNGASEVVESIAVFWSTVETLSKRKIDPLSAALIAQLDLAAAEKKG